MNRFGFSSTKKVTRPADHQRNAGPPSFFSATHNRISTIGGGFGEPNSNINFTPMQNQLGSMGGAVPSSLQVSGGKKFNFGSARPFSAKSSNRAVLDSARKSSIMASKLKFGVTPQHSRASYMQQNPVSTSRLSRSSMPGARGKDIRPLTDAAFHRECRAKMFEFLTVSDYPYEITQQALNKPSMAEITRIFEFLFSYFQPNVEIKNGPKTSIDVVVPKMLTDLNYPYQLKRSDLTSLSGGRQLGAVFDAICYLIDIISYTNNLDGSQFVKPLDFDDENESSNIRIQLFECALTEGDDIDESQLVELANNVFGTDEQLALLETDKADLEQQVKQQEEDIILLEDMPKRKLVRFDKLFLLPKILISKIVNLCRNMRKNFPVLINIWWRHPKKLQILLNFKQKLKMISLLREIFCEQLANSANERKSFSIHRKMCSSNIVSRVNVRRRSLRK